MKFRHDRRLSAQTELNVTPLMDLAFSLLIIFMISTPLLEQTIPINLPKQDQSAASARPEIKFQVISINGKGRIYWGKQPVDMAELNSLLGVLSSEPDPPPISLRADGSLPYQNVIDVIDLVKKHNLTKLHLDTEVR